MANEKKGKIFLCFYLNGKGNISFKSSLSPGDFTDISMQQYGNGFPLFFQLPGSTIYMPGGLSLTSLTLLSFSTGLAQVTS